MAVKLGFQEFGDGPPLVILHGLFGSARNWRTIAQHLADRRHVYTLDLRNHGSSAWADAMGYGELAGDVEAFLAERGIEPARVIGHSVGGKTAMLLALRRPGLVAALVVVDIAPDNYPHGFIDYVRAMQAIDLTACDRRARVEAVLSARIANPADRGFLMQNLVVEPDGLRWRVNLSAIASNMGELIDFPPEVADLVYDGPALFVAGEDSDYVQPEHHAIIRDMFPAAQMAFIPGAGHQVHAEQPERFLAAVRPFLDASLPNAVA